MTRFFDSFKSIQQFTSSLDFHLDQRECQFCFQPDQFVSHGIVYKQRTVKIKEPVGKRIFCSNRYGRSGCGRTFQLYIASEIPSLHYGAAQLIAFISGLFLGLSIEKAYPIATGANDTRHAWRWLSRLQSKLSDFRRFLCVKTATPALQFQVRVRSLQLLLPSLLDLFSHRPNAPCSHYQLWHQSAFI
tara:strand:- start:2024 stop:2587 length:564 start_codon:yes stop_codon:yes gene_type:complete